MARRRHNTQTDRDRQKLVADFEARLRYDTELGDRRAWLVRPHSIAWVVHPRGDEWDLLLELGMRPVECGSADAYWRYGDNVCFVETTALLAPRYWSSRYLQRPPGVYYRFDKIHRSDVFDALLPRLYVTNQDLHCVFDMLETLYDSGVIASARAALEDSPSRWLAREERLVAFR